MSVRAYQFDLALEVDAGLDAYLDEIAEQLIEAGCEDATFSVRHGVPRAEFTREAESLAEAVSSAFADISTVPDVHVVRLDLEQLVTASEIARRAGRSRQSVQQLITGTRGPGGFPEPVDWVHGVRLWPWPEVSQWLAEATGSPAPESRDEVELIAAINGALQARRHLARIEEPSQREAVEAILGRS